MRPCRSKSTKDESKIVDGARAKSAHNRRRSMANPKPLSRLKRGKRAYRVLAFTFCSNIAVSSSMKRTTEAAVQSDSSVFLEVFAEKSLSAKVRIDYTIKKYVSIAFYTTQSVRTKTSGTRQKSPCAHLYLLLGRCFRGPGSEALPPLARLDGGGGGALPREDKNDGSAEGRGQKCIRRYLCHMPLFLFAATSCAGLFIPAREVDSST